MAALCASVVPASASVSIAVAWDDLLRLSTDVAVATPMGASAQWEGGHIYTLWRLHVDRAIAGNVNAGDEIVVRTLGGEVGDTGQHVDGEAELAIGGPSLLFLQSEQGSAFHVTARAQGHFPIVAATAARSAFVVQSPAVGGIVSSAVVPPLAAPLLARDALHGLSVDDATLAVLSAWNRAHVR
jgi:hypothetical protein